MYDKSGILNQWGNDRGGTGMSGCLENIQLNLYHIVYPEIDYRCIKDLNAKI